MEKNTRSVAIQNTVEEMFTLSEVEGPLSRSRFSMRILRLNNKNLKKLAEITKESLEKGNLTVIPTGTVYVLAVNANSSNAVKKIFSFKGRQFGKGVSVLLNSVEDIKKYAAYNDSQKKIIETLLPGPFTVVLKSKGKTAPEIEPEDKTIGICVIEKPFVKELTRIISFPVTATSANVSGKGPHYSISSFLKTLSQKKKKMIDLIIDGGRLPKVPTTTIARLVEDNIEILREGIFKPTFLAKQKAPKPKDTKRIARKIYELYFKDSLKEKSVLAILKGEMGVGKTVFAQGIGELFGEHFSSPTFVLMDEYKIDKPPLKNIYHVDLYRIENKEEILCLKLEKLLTRGNLILIEWGEKLATFQDLKRKGGSFFLVRIDEGKQEEREIEIYRL